MTDADIQCVEGLKLIFHQNKNRMETFSCFVSTVVRRSWMLNHERTIIDGKVYDIIFSNRGGGVWEASLHPAAGK